MKILQGKLAEQIKTGSWHRMAIRQIEDLGNAVLGADLEAVQMAGPRVGGSLAFAADRGVIFSSGLISGKVTISGPLSHDAITLGVGLRFGPGSRHWLNEVLDGAVSVVLPGDEHDAYYTGGTLYLAATLTSERLEAIAEREELVLDRGALQCSGVHSEPVAAEPLAWIRSHAMRIHQRGSPIGERQAEIGAAMLRLVIDHYTRVPDRGVSRMNPKGRARIVHRARIHPREPGDTDLTGYPIGDGENLAAYIGTRIPRGPRGQPLQLRTPFETASHPPRIGYGSRSSMHNCDGCKALGDQRAGPFFRLVLRTVRGSAQQYAGTWQAASNGSAALSRLARSA